MTNEGKYARDMYFASAGEVEGLKIALGLVGPDGLIAEGLRIAIRFHMGIVSARLSVCVKMDAAEKAELAYATINNIAIANRRRSA